MPETVELVCARCSDALDVAEVCTFCQAEFCPQCWTGHECLTPEPRRPALPEVIQAAVVGPSDRLVVLVPEGTNLATLDRIQGLLEDRGLKGRVLVIAGAAQLAVITDATPTQTPEESA